MEPDTLHLRVQSKTPATWAARAGAEGGGGSASGTIREGHLAAVPPCKNTTESDSRGNIQPILNYTQALGDKLLGNSVGKICSYVVKGLDYHDTMIRSESTREEKAEFFSR